MTERRHSEPKFPIRVIFDDGDSTTVEEPDELFTHFNSLDSSDPSVIVRDDLDRNVRILMNGGELQLLEVSEE